MLFLEKLFKAEVVLCDNIDDDSYFEDADIIHLFNLQTIEYSYKAFKKAKAHKKKIVFSTIFWDLEPAINISFWFNRFSLPQTALVRLLNPFRKAIHCFSSLFGNKGNVVFGKYKRMAEEIVTGCDILLPNSDEEATIIQKLYGRTTNLLSKTIVVPNAIDKSTVSKGGLDDSCDNLPSGFVLQVGAINCVKNQINVVKALFDNKGIPIVFVGKQTDKKYFDKLKKISNRRGNVFFYDQVKNEEVFKFYRKAVCHVLPSFRESPGLSSLEALANGIQIVVSKSKYCPTHYYDFENCAHICDPYSCKSIKKAILSAISKPLTLDSKRIDSLFKKCSYENAAKITMQGYCAAIEK